MTALATTAAAAAPAEEKENLSRELCVICSQPVMWVIASGSPHLVDIVEWLPRMACQSCLHTRRAHPGRPVHCAKCGNSGYVGADRPKGRVIAIDLAWSDDEPPHTRQIGPHTDRRRGEALYTIHNCQIGASQ